MCGDYLSIDTTIDENTDELIINLFCEGSQSDEFSFDIHTGFTQNDIDQFSEIDKEIEMKMRVILLTKEPPPDADLDIEDE